MRDPGSFDDLARRKLEDRTFSFDEAHWQAVQQLQRSEARRRRNARARRAAALLLLLISGGLLWFLSGDHASQFAATGDENAPAQVAEQQEQVGPATSEALGSEGLDPVTEAVTSVEPSGPAPSSLETPKRHADEPSRTTSKPTAKGASFATIAPAEPKATGNANEAIPAPEVVVEIPPASEADPSDASVAGIDDLGMNSNEPLPASPSSTTDTDNARAPGIAKDTRGIDPVQITSQPPPALPVELGSDTGRTEPAPIDPLLRPVDPKTNERDLVTATTSQASDSALTPSPVEAPVQPIDRTYLELSFLGGAMSTHTAYSGGSSENWKGMISGSTAPSFGAELMHMKEHWGWGFGLHYTSYTERLRVDEQYATSTELYYTHTFTPVDTAVLNVIDTIVVGGQTYYVTETVNTTIWVLDTQIDSNTTTVLTREQVDRINRVSYVEVPLLLDIHGGRGHWRFGLRAGPTIGLLTARRGTLPIGPGGSLVALDEQPLHSTSLGYVARPYVRYLIGEAWSFGIEPCIRGQLLNGYASGDLSRRSSGIGVMASLAFRLN